MRGTIVPAGATTSDPSRRIGDRGRETEPPDGGLETPVDEVVEAHRTLRCRSRRAVRPSGLTDSDCGREVIGLENVAIAAGLRRSVASSVPSVCGEGLRFTASRASSIARSIRGSLTASAPSWRASATVASWFA